ncbi:hypothetical protein [Cryobacterium sp. SO1]|uniref:hypothetical protein n=1 Tax=Cryobacterium sp. SO1 TaxID=1897061 RepID=UPI0010237793|nr:hypothetical protein [Cryobacterium sp. SO1]RZI35236.1 hypothetical protein BJQ95_02302 [Cryobacterium sp. SO1]
MTITDAKIRKEETEQTLPEVDALDIRRILEYYEAQGWSDGLPVAPTTESVIREFLATTPKAPEEVLFEIPHLNRRLTVRLAAINAALAGCRPEYFPVVVAAWEAIAQEPHPRNGIWQSTTGSAPLTLVNGPVRERLDINSRGNIFGSGHRANATIGRAIRLALINVFALRPHGLDQATQGTPAKYTMCIAENEEESPWDPLHTEYGFERDQDVVTAFVIRSVIHIEARQTKSPEHLALDFTNTIKRTGSLIHEYTNALLVLSPEHARLFADAGWSKEDLRRFIFKHAVLPRSVLNEVGKDAISHHTQWRLASDHPDAVGDIASESGTPDQVPVLAAPSSVQIMVGGANNAGVSAIVEILGLRSQIHSSSYSPVHYVS